MAFADSDFVKLNLPEGTSFTRNGVTISVADAVTNALDEAGSREGALVILFTMLEADHLKSETIGKYSYERWGMRGSDYWRLQSASISMSGSDAAPNVTFRPSKLGRGAC